MEHIFYTADGIRKDLCHFMSATELEQFVVWMENHPSVDLTGRNEDYLVRGWSSLNGWVQNWAHRPLQVCNAFSLNMLPPGAVLVNVVDVSVEDIRDLTSRRPLESVIGHPDTAAVFSTTLGLELPFNRATVKLQRGQDILVGQYIGPRLAEGTMVLPEGAKIEWKIVRLA